MESALVEDLRQQLARRQVVLIIGSGVSMAATGGAEVAGWQGLLRHGVRRLRELGLVKPTWVARQEAALLDTEIEPDELLAIADQIMAKLDAPSGGEYRLWLRDTVGSLRISKPDVPQALVALSAPLCTTNYDGLLEQASGLPAVTWRDTSSCDRVLRGDKQAVIHLHGHYESPESVVLGSRSYQDVLGAEYAQRMLQALRLHRTFLFVGFGQGLADPNFARLLKWSSEALRDSESRSYQLVLERDLPSVQRERPLAMRLSPIAYGAQHDDLPGFLRRLIVESPATAVASSESPRERALREAIATYRDQQAHKNRRMFLSDLAKRSEDSDLAGGIDRLPLFIPQKLQPLPSGPQQLAGLLNAARAGGAPAMPSAMASMLSMGQAVLDPTGGLNPSLLAPQRSRALEQVLAEESLIVLLGDPGSGKSEITRWIVAKLCTPGENLPGLPADTVPVRVELRLLDAMAQGKPELDLMQQIAELHRVDQLALDADQLATLSKAQRLLLLLDGLDEVPDAARRRRYAEQAQALHRRDGCRVLLTSRVLGAEGPLEALPAAAVHRVEGFDDDQVQAFLTRWHDLAFAPAQRDRAQHCQTRLREALSRSGSLHELARNPLLLTLLCLLNRGDELPRRRHQVFAQALDLMIGQWEANKSLPTGSAVFERTDKNTFLRQLAWDMQAGRWPGSAGNVVSADDLRLFARDFCRDRFGLPLDSAEQTAQQLLSHLSARNHVLSPLGESRYGFVHKAFFEQLVAERARAKLSPTELCDLYAQRWNDPAWTEALYLLSGMLADDDRSADLVSALQQGLRPLPAALDREDTRCEYYAFCVRCLAEVSSPQAEPVRSFLLALMRLIQEDAAHPTGFMGAKRDRLLEALLWFEPRWPASWLPWAEELGRARSTSIYAYGVALYASPIGDTVTILECMRHLILRNFNASSISAQSQSSIMDQQSPSLRVILSISVTANNLPQNPRALEYLTENKDHLSWPGLYLLILLKEKNSNSSANQGHVLSQQEARAALPNYTANDIIHSIRNRIHPPSSTLGQLFHWSAAYIFSTQSSDQEKTDLLTEFLRNNQRHPWQIALLSTALHDANALRHLLSNGIPGAQPIVLFLIAEHCLSRDPGIQDYSRFIHDFFAETKDEWACEAAAEYLCESQTEAPPPIALQRMEELALRGKEEGVRVRAAAWLGLYPLLVELAETATDAEARSQAAHVLAFMDARAAALRVGQRSKRRGRVYYDGQRAGTLEETERGGSRFVYDAGWLRRRDAVPISLSMPLRSEAYEGDGLLPFFANLLPEGALLDATAKKAGVSREDEFGLLLAAGADCAGAVEVRPDTPDTKDRS